MGLQVLHRRDAELRVEYASQVAVAHAQPFGQPAHRNVIAGPAIGIIEHPCGLVRQDR